MTAVGQGLLVLSPDIVLLDAADGLRLWHSAQTWELAVGHTTAEVLSAFAAPITLAGALARLRARHPRVADADLRPIVDELRAAGVLVDHVPRVAVTPAGRGGMFAAPVLPLAELARGEVADVVFLGAPYDLGVTHRPGTRLAPAYLRAASRALYQHRDGPAGPLGMFDPCTGRRVLQGVRLADAGDLAATVFHRNGPHFDDLAQFVEVLVRRGRRPVLLGGDHSLSLAAIRGAAAACGRIAVVHVDAHADLGSVAPGEWHEQCHHGNFMNWVLTNPGVARLVQIGVRQLEPAAPVEHPNLFVWPGRSAVGRPLEELVAAIPADVPCYLTLDVDALDPSVIAGTGTPLPGGFLHHELAAILAGICRLRRVVGFDAMELIPGASDAEGLVVCDLLLRALDAAFARAEDA